MRGVRWIVILWLVALAAIWAVLVSRGDGPAATVAALLAALDDSRWAFLALVIAYGVRSLVFLPMTVLTVFAGFLLGPWWGGLVALLGGVGSAATSYGLARWARGGLANRRRAAAEDGGGGFLTRGRLVALRERPFETVLTARLVAVPGDVVNVLAGAWRVPLAPFAAATALGGLPGVLAGVFAGASIEGAFRWTGLEVRPSLVVASLTMLVVSLGLSALVRRRAGHGGNADADEAGGSP